MIPRTEEHRDVTMIKEREADLSAGADNNFGFYSFSLLIFVISEINRNYIFSFFDRSRFQRSLALLSM